MTKLAKLLTIESTCDETAAAVIDGERNVLSSVIATQEELHERFGGVVPEIASRAHIERILPVIDTALKKAETSLQELDAVAVANGPGLAGSLLVGLMAAKSLSLALNKPLIAVDHLQAHIYACRMDAGRDIFPCVGMIVSGGHSSLYRCDSPLEFTTLGGTIDDAAGEAFDKVASMLGLGFPGGPAMQRAAEGGDATRFKLPRPLLSDKDRLEFSFSGLKTAVRYKLFGPANPVDVEKLDAGLIEGGLVADMAASVQQAIIDCLLGKALLAVEKTGLDTLCVGGGVAANGPFRDQLTELAEREGIELHIAPRSLCTDNAAMGAIAVERFNAGLFEGLDLDISPGLRRPGK
ncbi:MAG: tRNA (adenosine(37)-N6)-threonylcarbamoyltransferase complex transferase subunit TsaD [Lacipirellulaceae bacterium]